MQSVSPVYTEREVDSEQVIALGQEEYYPVVAARIIFKDDSIATVVRYRFTEIERKAIAEGADLVLTQPHHGSLMPVGLQLAFPNEYPLEDL